MKMSTSLKAIVASVGFVLAGQAMADVTCLPGDSPHNCAPPVGSIFETRTLGTNPSVLTQYFVSFIATETSTNVSFAMREDPSFMQLDDIVVVAHGSATNLIVNGGFEDGNGSDLGQHQPVGWEYLNEFNAGANGVVSTSRPHSGTYSYSDGSVLAYDVISQAIATQIGQLYDLSFWLVDGHSATFSDAINLTVYAGIVPTLAPTGVPEPESLALLGLGLAALGLARRRKA